MSRRSLPYAFAAALLLAVATLAIFLQYDQRRGGPGGADVFPPKAGPIPVATVVDREARLTTAVDDVAVPRRPDLDLPAMDHAELIEKANAAETAGRFRFATQRHVAIDPSAHGRWESLGGGRSKWQLDLQSAGATSLNLAFSEFHLPPGASLAFAGEHETYEFTEADNDAHGQLWTPMVRGDRAVLEVEIDDAMAPRMQLVLASVNHGFRGFGAKDNKIGDDASGSCNIDVACDASDNSQWGVLIDMYRDQINAVGAYTLSGIDTCSGALINNTNNDSKPYFLTADHCGITVGNAPSMVVYWNFQNTTCRQPGSTASGQDGDGPINQVNSGAIFRATSSTSDFCLVELDDAVDPATEPFYAGWDRSGSESPSSVAIHHPAVSEKRISFDLDPTATSSYYGTSSPGAGTHIRVNDWDYGTTEGGSSGSALFDANGRIIGQLHGGDAACGNDDPDWYGRLSVSWSGGGSNSNRLSNWLDPSGTGATAIDGLGGSDPLPIASVTGGTITEGDAGSSNFTVQIALAPASSDPVSVRLRTQTASQNPATSGSDFSPLDQVVTFAAGQTQRTVNLTVSGDTTPEENEEIIVELSEPSGARVATGTARVVILNDDFTEPVITSSLTASGVAAQPFSYQIVADNTPTSYAISGGPSGMTVGAITGQLNWPNPSAGTQTVTISATNPGGTDSEILTITLVASALADALDLTPDIGVTSAGPAWFRQTTTTSDGVDAAEGANITHNQSSAMSVTVNGPDTLFFRWKVDSEEGWDFLQVALDGARRAQMSGDVDWKPMSIFIPAGSHTVTWTYVKDGSESDGADTGWVDRVGLGSNSPVPIITSPDRVTAFAAGAFVYQVTATGSPTSYAAMSLPAGLSIDAATGRISGTLSGTGSSTFNVSATNVDGTGSQDVTVDRLTPDAAIPPAIEAAGTPITTDGWFVDDGNGFTGGSSARSEDIGNNGSSTMTAHLVGPGDATFRWTVSSEANYDYFSVYIDEQRIDRISGSVDWTAVTVPIPAGQHELRWVYAKDESESSGADAGLVDDLQLTGYAGFAAATGLSPAAMLPESDADGDGQSNLAEFVFATDPAVVGQPGLLAIERDGAGVRLAFDGRADLSGLTVKLEESTTLDAGSWQDAGVTMQSGTASGGVAEHAFSIPGRDTRCFFRVTVTN